MMLDIRSTATPWPWKHVQGSRPLTTQLQKGCRQALIIPYQDCTTDIRRAPELWDMSWDYGLWCVSIGTERCRPYCPCAHRKSDPWTIGISTRAGLYPLCSWLLSSDFSPKLNITDRYPPWVVHLVAIAGIVGQTRVFAMAGYMNWAPNAAFHFGLPPGLTSGHTN